MIIFNVTGKKYKPRFRHYPFTLGLEFLCDRLYLSTHRVNTLNLIKLFLIIFKRILILYEHAPGHVITRKINTVSNDEVRCLLKVHKDRLSKEVIKTRSVCFFLGTCADTTTVTEIPTTLSELFDVTL